MMAHFEDFQADRRGAAMPVTDPTSALLATLATSSSTQRSHISFSMMSPDETRVLMSSEELYMRSLITACPT